MSNDFVRQLRDQSFQCSGPQSDVLDAVAVHIETLEMKLGSATKHAQLLNKMLGAEEARTEAAEARAGRLREALEAIANHWANQYDHQYKNNPMYEGSYGIGVTDGHRACTIIARKALEDDNETHHS